MKSSLFVAFMIKFRQDFTEYKSSEKPTKMLHFSPLVLFLLHYEFIFTPMRVPWNFHGISMEFVLSSCLCWNAFSRIIPGTLWNGDATIYPAAESFYGIRVPPGWFAKVSRTNIQMYDALHVFASYIWIFVRETLANQVYSNTIKAFCCGVNCGIAISKCTGYYTRKCVSAQTTRKHKFHGNSMELSCE
jgi:hypothetical protein